MKMELFILEHKKLWRKTSVRICVLLCFSYVVIFGGVLSYQWFTLGSPNDITSAFGNNFDGYSMIRTAQDRGEGYGGVLTDQSLQQMVADYQTLDAAGLTKEKRCIDWEVIETYLNQLYPELEILGDDRLMIRYVDAGKLTGFYERRQAALEEFLKNNNQTGEEAEMLIAMNDKVLEPFQYQWVKGWNTVLSDILPGLSSGMALFLAIVLSSVFSGEWHDNTAPMILTMKNGWSGFASAKVLSGLAFALELFAFCAIGSFVAQLFFMGLSGWNMPIQVIKLIAVAPMNMIQAEFFEYGFTLLGVIGFTGIVMLLSAMVKSNVLALLFSLAVVYAPMAISNYLPYSLQKALNLIPLVGNSTDIFRTITFHIFGKYIWSPYFMLIVPVLIGIVCLPFAMKKWSRRIKA